MLVAPHGTTEGPGHTRTPGPAAQFRHGAHSLSAAELWPVRRELRVAERTRALTDRTGHGSRDRDTEQLFIVLPHQEWRMYLSLGTRATEQAHLKLCARETYGEFCRVTRVLAVFHPR